MQQIERYGVIALVFLLVTIVAVSFWGDSKSPGFWARLTGKAKKQDVAQVDPGAPAPFQPAGTPATTSEQALQTSLALNPAPAGDPNAPLNTPVAGAPVDPFAPNTPPTAAGTTTNDPLAMSAPAGNLATTPAPLGRAPATTPAPVTTPVVDPALANAPAAPAAEGANLYVVQKGDSLARIARRTLGAESRWTEIQALNDGITPNKLKVGMKLKLPAGAAATDTASTPSVASAAKAPAAKKSQPKSASKPEAKKAAPASSNVAMYTVKKGDTLHSIAESKLGGKSHVREILALNPGLDPRRMSVGTRIKLPAADAGPVVAAASHSASSRPQVR